jgi:hypothetical protein
MEAIKRKFSRVVYRLLLNGGYQKKALQATLESFRLIASI